MPWAQKQATKHLIDPAHFTLLEELNTNLLEYQESDDTVFDAERIDQFIDILQRINEIRSVYPTMKAFDLSKWEQVKVAGGRVAVGTVEAANLGLGAGSPIAGIIP